MRRRHRGTAVLFVSCGKLWHRGVGGTRRDQVRTGKLGSPAREIGNWIRGLVGGCESTENQWLGGTNREHLDRTAGKTEGAQPRAVVGGGHGHHHVRICLEHRINKGINLGGAFSLVAHSEREIDHQRHPSLAGNADCVCQRLHHRSRYGDAAVGIVGDLQSEKGCARGHSVEAGYAVHAVPGGDAGHMAAVTAGVEEEIEDWSSG